MKKLLHKLKTILADLWDIVLLIISIAAFGWCFEEEAHDPYEENEDKPQSGAGGPTKA